MTQKLSDDNSQLLTLLPLINKTIISAFRPKELGYTKTQLFIFSALNMYGSLTMSQVAGYISSSKEQATRAVAPLVDDGLVERYIDPENRTRIHIRFTEKGKEFIIHYKRRFLDNLHHSMLQQISQEEMLELKQAVETMIRILSKMN